MRHAIFIGSNPSASANSWEPFCISTKSGRTLHEWIKRANVEIIGMINVHSYPTPNNKPLTNTQIVSSLPNITAYLSMYRQNPPIVAVGKTAAKALTLLGIPFYELPHPSGMNRLCNDKEYVEEKLKGLSAYAERPIKSI